MGPFHGVEGRPAPRWQRPNAARSVAMIAGLYSKRAGRMSTRPSVRPGVVPILAFRKLPPRTHLDGRDRACRCVDRRTAGRREAEAARLAPPSLRPGPCDRGRRRPNPHEASPAVSSRATSTTGASASCEPRARISRATTVKMRVRSSGSHELARPMACGKCVVPRAAYPCRPSSWNRIGMPRRVPAA